MNVFENISVFLYKNMFFFKLRKVKGDNVKKRELILCNQFY